MLAGIKALLFDLDNTLLDDNRGTREALRRACHFACRKRWPLDGEDLQEGLARRARFLWERSVFYPYLQQIEITFMEGLCVLQDGGGDETMELRGWLSHYRQACWHDALREQGVSDEHFAAVLARQYRKLRGQHNYTYPQARETLTALKPYYRLALITNGASDLQRKKIEDAGLGSFFDVIVVSGEEGVGKPDPKIFLAALGKLNLDSTQAVMIGDSFERDIQGAAKAGLQAIWFGKDGLFRQRKTLPESSEELDGCPVDENGVTRIPSMTSLRSLLTPQTSYSVP